MPENPTRDTSDFLLGMVVGVIAGGVVSMWLAPRSGRDTRQEIQKIVVTLRTQAQDRVQRLVTPAQGAGSTEHDTDMVIKSEMMDNS